MILISRVVIVEGLQFFYMPKQRFELSSLPSIDLSNFHC